MGFRMQPERQSLLTCRNMPCSLSAGSNHHLGACCYSACRATLPLPLHAQALK